MSFMELVQWVLVYMGQTLLALVVLTLWGGLAYLIYDEIKALLRPEPKRSKKDTDTYGGPE